jgi:hypothetical protein
MAKAESYLQTSLLTRRSLGWAAFIGLGAACLLAGCGALYPPPAPPANVANTAATPGPAMSNTETAAEPTAAPAAFYDVLTASLAERGQNLESVCPQADPVAKRVMQDYGAMFVAGPQVKAPPVCVFASDEQVKQFQQAAGNIAQNFGAVAIELQPEAMKALLAARADAQTQGLDITPRGGEAARRSYPDTVRLWESRFTPALAHWQQLGKIPAAQAAQLRAAALPEQVRGVLELEARGLWFSKDFSKSILYSVAAPGASQHLSMLALDVTEFANPRARAILAQRGWFQTVQSDLPHFTYLGLKESELPARGLRRVVSGGQVFWIPNVN